VIVLVVDFANVLHRQAPPHAHPPGASASRPPSSPSKHSKGYPCRTFSTCRIVITERRRTMVGTSCPQQLLPNYSGPRCSSRSLLSGDRDNFDGAERLRLPQRVGHIGCRDNSFNHEQNPKLASLAAGLRSNAT
jgi:hypothetical protein